MEYIYTIYRFIQNNGYVVCNKWLLVRLFLSQQVEKNQYMTKVDMSF